MVYWKGPVVLSSDRRSGSDLLPEVSDVWKEEPGTVEVPLEPALRARTC